MVAQEVHTRPMPLGEAGPQRKSVSIQTDNTYPNTQELIEENRDLEKRLRHVSYFGGSIMFNLGTSVISFIFHTYR